MQVYDSLTGKEIRINPADSIGKGGEADIFRIGPDTVAKIFKQPDHPDYANNKTEQEGARKKIANHQTKLRAFPPGLPNKVIVPQSLLLDGRKKIVGYTMRFIQGEVLYSYTRRNFRESHKVEESSIVEIFKGMYNTISALHKQNVVIGDFNYLNIVVSGEEAWFIDADSFQFGNYPCLSFTNTFLDPNHCDTQMVMVSPHSTSSDWYAYDNMLLRSLLFTGPFDGVYRPKDPKKEVLLNLRPKHGISIFHPEVIYPKPARKFQCLSDELLHRFEEVFVKGKRSPFPIQLLTQLRWVTCPKCGMLHTRTHCPECMSAVPKVPKQTIVRRGNVHATTLFTTEGLIVCASYQNGELRWLYHDGSVLKNERGVTLLAGRMRPGHHFKISSEKTLSANGNNLTVIAESGQSRQLSIDSYAGHPVFAANSEHYYWLENGVLMRDDRFGSKQMGNTLPGQTQIWAGEEFGFGFYRASLLSIAFVFGTKNPGIKDNLEFPIIGGQIIETNCIFSERLAWFLYTGISGGKTTNYCLVYDQNGNLLATAEETSGSDSWLGTITAKMAAGNRMFCATDSGIVEVGIDQGSVYTAKTYPDTEPFVSTDSKLLASSKGIYVIDSKQITLLQIV